MPICGVYTSRLSISVYCIQYIIARRPLTSHLSPSQAFFHLPPLTQSDSSGATLPCHGKHPSNLPTSSDLPKPSTALPSFLLSSDGSTTRACYMPCALECHQNSRNRPCPSLHCAVLRALECLPPGRRDPVPRSYTLVLPSVSGSAEIAIAPTCFLREAFGLTQPPTSLPATHATRHSLQRTKHNHHHSAT